MEKMVLLRSVCRAASFRYSRSAAITGHHLRHHLASRSIFTLSAPAPLNRITSGYDSRFVIGIGNRRYFSEDATHLPAIQDSDIHNVFKDLMAASWDEIYDTVIHDVKKALSKSTDDKAAQEILKNVFRAAEAVEEFSGMLMSLKMELDDSIGLSGEDVKPLSDEFANALRTVFQRYSAYLDAFGPDETYLRKKVETELGSKMIYLKMRCSGLGSEWGKVTVLGTSGLAGSYVEHRA
ncbi:succinate dehydrogenase subunit 5, mitochondrial [Euphorbia lathyris]|uniref:succinate dehydrogenase subunit 5, mitochondrial n=1 Tax=Euphorbia lathyris TaxID=212925 RepID=UPI00331430C7